MNVVKIEDIELDLAKLNRKTCELPEEVLKYLNDYLHPYEGIELSLRGGWGMEEAVSQFKIPTKRSPNGKLGNIHQNFECMLRAYCRLRLSMGYSDCY